MTDDSFYWTPEWQKMESEAEEDLSKGHYDEFDSLSDLIEDLESRIDSGSNGIKNEAVLDRLPKSDS